MNLLMQRSQYAVLVLALTLPPLTIYAASKPSYGKADQNSDGSVTIQEAKKLGVPKKEAKREDLDGDGKLTKIDWRFVEIKPQKGSE